MVVLGQISETILMVVVVVVGMVLVEMLLLLETAMVFVLWVDVDFEIH